MRSVERPRGLGWTEGGLTATTHSLWDRVVARNRRIPLSGTLENLKRFLDDTLGGAFRKNSSVRSAETFSATAALISWFTATPWAFAILLASSINDG